MIIAVASGKGGTGKTFVSTNLFWAAQKQGIPSTLVDCDAEEPNDAEFIPRLCAEHAKRSSKKIPVSMIKNAHFAAGASIIAPIMPLFICPTNAL
jgi:MinD superfamily P-loop ATPase